MKVALAHEYFSVHGGAEAVVEVLHALWPGAPVYTFFHDRARYGPLPGWDIRASYLQRLAIGGGGSHRLLLPLYPGAATRLRVSADTNVLLTSTSGFIKGLSLGERTAHVAYCHSPTRYLWDHSDEYVRDEVPFPLRPLARDVIRRLRPADLAFARRVDRWLANSHAVRDRIARYYGAPAEVVHPPVDVDSFVPAPRRGDFWLFVGRLVRYKHADVAIRAFNEIGMRLMIVGEGRERRSLERLARDNVTFAGRVSETTKRELLGAARGLVFPAEDDFGMVCAEALASGAPVVALRAGGAPEIVRGGVDGALVDEATPEAFADGVRRVEREAFDADALRESARRFDVSRFRDRITHVVAEAGQRGRG